MKKLSQLFKNNQAWSQKQLSEDPFYFHKLSQKQEPEYLWIGCSDSRVPSNQITGLKPGELLVHRNIANLCIHTDLNFLSVLEFAVRKLEVKEIIVCGHYGCGGIITALENKESGLLDNWLRNIRDIHSKYSEELKPIHSNEEKLRRLVELNVEEQVKNISHTSIVQKAWRSGKRLSIHGWVYELSQGKLKDLNVTFSKSEQVHSYYRIH